MKSFWNTIHNKRAAEGRPLVVLAPMADVTDVAFRALFVKYGQPDVIWTEFVACDGMFHTAKKIGIHTPKEAATYAKEFYQDHMRATLRVAPDAKEYGDVAFNLFLKDLQFESNEHPIVAQLFTGNLDTMEWGAELVARLGFDGIDINMGCPVNKIVKQEGGSALIKDPENAREIIRAAKRGVKNASTFFKKPIPVTVKTRLGFNADELEEWLPILLAEKPAVITLHARTRKEMSKVPAKWDRIKKAVEIRNELKSDTLIFGNGDVNNLEHALARHHESDCDGIMIGRGIFGDPWFFNPAIDREKDISIPERLRVMLEHTKLFAELLPHKNFAVMKKHYKAYVDGFPRAKELRIALMDSKSVKEIEEVVESFIKNELEE